MIYLKQIRKTKQTPRVQVQLRLRDQNRTSENHVILLVWHPCSVSDAVLRLASQTLAIKTCQSKELSLLQMNDLKPLFWMFVLDELVFLLFLSGNHSYPCPLFCVLLSFQKGPTLTISHPPSNLRPATPYACVDAIIEVSAANIVQQRSFIEVTQWKPQMNRCHMSCFLFCEMPCLDPLKKKNTSYIDLFGEISPFFGGGEWSCFLWFFWGRKKQQIQDANHLLLSSNWDPLVVHSPAAPQTLIPVIKLGGHFCGGMFLLVVLDPKHPWFANHKQKEKHHVLTETCGKSRERAQFWLFFGGGKVVMTWMMQFSCDWTFFLGEQSQPGHLPQCTYLFRNPKSEAKNPG